VAPWTRFVWPLLGAFLIAVSVTWLMEFAAVRVHGTPFADWQHYAMAWNRVVAGGDLYHPSQLTGPFTFPSMLFIGWAYPPASVVFWAPFSTWPAGWVLWTTVNVGLFLTALWAAVTRTFPARRVEVMGFALIALSQYGPFVEAAQLGNADLALAGLFAWAWLLGPRAAVIAGVLGGAAKIVPVGMLLFASRHGWRWTLYGIGALGAIGVATLPLVGLDSWFEYASSLALATAPCAPERPHNVAIACQLAHPAARTIGILAGMALSVGAGLVQSHFWAFALAVMAYPVANHDLRGHTWVVVLAVALAAVMELADPRRDDPARARRIVRERQSESLPTRVYLGRWRRLR
jgi:Glycosyltransferase family 87